MNRGRSGFTLIELMVVVALMSIFAAILIPNFLRARQQGLQRQAQRVAEQTPAAGVEPPPVKTALINLEASELQMCLQGWSTRLGMEVTNRYRLRYKGLFRVDAFRSQLGELQLAFPDATDEASDIVVRVRRRGAWQPYLAWSASNWGLSLALSEPDIEQIEVSFQAQGRDQLVLPLPRAGRLGTIRCSLQVDPGCTAVVAESSLQPTSRVQDGWTWEYQNLVSSAPLRVELPPSHSLMGKVLLLCRLAGLAVFLFGLGFWYLGELYRPGYLSRFKWGHFLMLSLTYCFFFPVLAVLSLGQGLPMTVALPVAAALSLPLLTLHVSMAADRKFTLYYTVPWALFTLALVVNGVFSENNRDLAFVGAGFLIVAGTTASYPRWSRNRKAWSEQQRHELLLRVQKAGQQVQALLENGDARQTAGARESLKEIDRISQDLSGGELWILQNRVTQLEAEVKRLETLPRLPASNKAHVHCTQCGHAGPSTPFCSKCGAARAKRLRCACGAECHGADLFKHCPGCGKNLK